MKQENFQRQKPKGSICYKNGQNEDKEIIHHMWTDYLTMKAEMDKKVFQQQLVSITGRWSLIYLV